MPYNMVYSVGQTYWIDSSTPITFQTSDVPLNTILGRIVIVQEIILSRFELDEKLISIVFVHYFQNTISGSVGNLIVTFSKRYILVLVPPSSCNL